jgi:hypothetical protein
VSGWKSQLTDEQITKVLHTVNRFGLTFYGDQDEADYEILNGEKIASQIKTFGYAH